MIDDKVASINQKMKDAFLRHRRSLGIMLPLLYVNKLNHELENP